VRSSQTERPAQGEERRATLALLEELRAELQAVRAEQARLRAEVRRLRQENQDLREALHQTLAPAQPNAAASSGRTLVEPPAHHWLSTSSGTRHNASCRFYRNTVGRPCEPTEGKPCKVCGG
jgi:sarcosine oxidase gamma subunit